MPYGRIRAARHPIERRVIPAPRVEGKATVALTPTAPYSPAAMSKRYGRILATVVKG